MFGLYEFVSKIYKTLTKYILKMSKRSLQASEQGIQEAKKAFNRTGLTQQQLANEVNCKSRQPIWKFFRGEPIESQIFLNICDFLELDMQDIVAWQPEQKPNQTSINIDSLVQDIRAKIKPIVQQRCGTIRVLDMTQPIGLTDIYTNVNILEQIAGSRRLTIANLLEGFDPESENFDRFGLSRIIKERVPGLKAVERYPKLMILGKPGSGKTTFLKYLAIQCSYGEIFTNLVPIFITLREFAEAKNQPTYLEFMTQLLSSCNVAIDEIIEILKEGRCLILLDGLDEVTEEDTHRIIKQIQEFSSKYYQNQFVITCRIAAQEYTFEKFTEVEIADFNPTQIKSFITKWFQSKENINLPSNNLEIAGSNAERCLQQLQSNPPIRELATNPLLLTLLLLEFEDAGDFPSNRAELYKQGITTLLRKWDAKRGIIRRDEIYKKLSVQRKKDLLSQIALTTFEHKDYFFKQQTIESYITDFIRNLPDAQTDPKLLQLDSEAVLKSIEAQHGLLVERARGIYSFSHLTFQEYFTARKIVNSSGPKALEIASKNLVNHITEHRWREVFMLAVGMLQPADYLLQLMKKQVDELVANDEKLQQFLLWVKEKSASVEVPYKSAAVRAFYFQLGCDRYSQLNALDYCDRELISLLDRRLFILLALGNIHTLDLGLDDLLTLACDRTLKIDFSTSSPYPFKGAFFLVCERANILAPKLGKALQELKNQLPDINADSWKFRQWWDNNSLTWIKNLKLVMLEYRNIGHSWLFNKQQQKLLQQYYDANKLLVDCLNSDCYVSREVRQEIEESLLLPKS